jgi:hypothetical protein
VWLLEFMARACWNLWPGLVVVLLGFVVCDGNIQIKSNDWVQRWKHTVMLWYAIDSLSQSNTSFIRGIFVLMTAQSLGLWGRHMDFIWISQRWKIRKASVIDRRTLHNTIAVHIVVGPCPKGHFIHAGSQGLEFFFFFLIRWIFIFILFT